MAMCKRNPATVNCVQKADSGNTSRSNRPIPERPATGVKTCRSKRGFAGTAGTALIVDDDQLLRNLARAALVHLGFTVLEAKDGREALEVFQRHRHCIGFILCDVHMPHMNGWETLTALRQLAPDFPFILSSGDKREMVMTGSHRERPQVFLPKPYGLTELREAIRKALPVNHKKEMREFSAWSQPGRNSPSR